MVTYNKFYHFVPKDPQDMTEDELTDEMESCQEYERECIRIGQGINSKENMRERGVRAELNRRLSERENLTYNQKIEDGICIKCNGDDVECIADCTKHVCGNCKFTLWDVTKDSYKASYEDTMPCLECGGLVDGEGVFSTGTPLEYHNPTPGEILKNIWMECGNCGWNQCS